MTGQLYKSFLRSQKGATAVEFALVVVPFLLLAFGVVEFGRAMWTRSVLESIATAGARCVGVRQDACALAGVYSSARTLSFVQNKARDLNVTLPLSGIIVSASTDCAGVTGFARVAITYQFKSVVPAFIPALKNGIPLTVASCFPNQPVSS